MKELKSARAIKLNGIIAALRILYPLRTILRKGYRCKPGDISNRHIAYIKDSFSLT